MAWLHTLVCLVYRVNDWRRRGGCLGGDGLLPYWPPDCDGALEVHHDRPGGAKATDKRTAPICTGHHRTGERSLATLGREGFQKTHGIDMDDETAYYEAQWQAHKSEGVFE